jgi:anti-sigma factor RsiW
MTMKWRLNSCRAHRENISLLVSGALPDVERDAAHDHLARCARCRDRYEEIASLSADLRQWVATRPAVEVDTDFRGRWMRSVQAAGGPARTSFATRISSWSETLWPSPLAWGALATVWTLLLCIQWAAAPQRAPSHQMAKSRPTRTEMTFAQRQEELSSLLEGFSGPGAPASQPRPRPRTERHPDSART